MKTINSQGFVFLTVLVFLQLLSFLGLSALMSTTLLTRSYTHDWQHTETRMRADQLMKQIEDNINTVSTFCIISTIAPVELAQKTLSWWRTHACDGNFYQIRYYYVVEALGIDPCGWMSQANDNHKLVAQFYRLTLFVLPSNKGDAIMRLQSTIATMMDAMETCYGYSHPVMRGRQMWREIRSSR